MAERAYTTANGYRYGFNGMEKDNEVKGQGNSYDYGARIYDPRIAKWFSIDKLSSKFADESNYCFVSNTPIAFKDADGNILTPTFKSPEAKEAFVKLVNDHLGGQFAVKLIPLKGQADVFTVSIVATKGGGKTDNLNKFDKAFYTEVTKVTKDTKVNVKIDVDYKIGAMVGNANAPEIDVYDMLQAESTNAGKDPSEYTQTSGGLFVHEIIEQYVLQSRGITAKKSGEGEVYLNYHDQKNSKGQVIKKGAHTYGKEAEDRVNGVKQIGNGTDGANEKGERYNAFQLENGNEFRIYQSDGGKGNTKTETIKGKTATLQSEQKPKK
jgi:RHS repeat-associated protein